jgi:hypothetical protein
MIPKGRKENTAIMSGPVIRVTMFKIPSTENQLKMAENYKTLSATATKVRQTTTSPPFFFLSLLDIQLSMFFY